MLLFLETATTGAGAGAGGFNMLSGILPLILFGVIIYFMMIRPENKRKKEAEEMRSSIKVGDEISTIGGIVGTVVNIKEDRIVIETGADQVRIELLKWAVGTNESASARAQEEAKKAKEAKAKAQAAKKAEKM
jgi:preprotein translocase subunit YajC